MSQTSGIIDERGGLPSASSMDADVRCYGRRALIAKFGKPDDSTKWSMRGDKIHQALEKNEITGLCTSDQITAERIMNEEARLVDKWSLQGASVFKERRLWAMGPDLKPIYSGKLDKSYVQGTAALIIDYKSGFAPIVPIDRNYQMKTQAVLARINYGVKAVIDALIHPHHPDNLLSQVMPFREEHLDYAEAELEGHVAQMTEGAIRTPNAISCAYCPVKKRCSEHQEWIASILPENKSDLRRAKLESMTPEERGQRLQLHAAVEEVIEEEKGVCKEFLKADKDSVLGYKLVPGSERNITDHKRAMEIVDGILGPSYGADCMEFSITKAKEVFVKAGQVKKSKADEFVDEKLKEVIEKKRRSPSLKQA